MRASAPTSAVLCVLATLASGAVPAGPAVQSTASVVAEPSTAKADLAGFDRFELADASLHADLPRSTGSERARRELQMHLRDRLGPWLALRNAQAARAQPPRTLRIEPAIVVLRAIDPGVRVAVGRWIGSEQLQVRVRFVDVASGDVVGEARLRADGAGLTPVSTLDATAPALPRRIADALADYLEATVAPT
jgi:hypothetical protein